MIRFWEIFALVLWVAGGALLAFAAIGLIIQSVWMMFQ